MMTQQFSVHADGPVKTEYSDVPGVHRARWFELVLTDDDGSVNIVVFAPRDDVESWLRETAASLRELADTMQEAADKEGTA